jgi:hypothetical protein
MNRISRRCVSAPFRLHLDSYTNHQTMLDLNESLLMDGAMLHIQADFHWLNICGERLERVVILS